MTDLIWLNGEILPLSEARISPEDRGYQFADGVYEVIRLYAGKPFTLDEHLARLERSAAGIQISVPLARPTLRSEIAKLIAQSGVGEGMIYLQLTRGVAPRNHVFPKNPGTTLLFYARALDPLPGVENNPPVKILTVEDERWKRCWIKSIALLPNVLAKNQAVAAGADEAVFVENGVVTECSASNFYAVIGGKLVTHPIGPKVLPGITRAVLFDAAKQIGVAVDERPIRLDEAKAADEIFITSTTREISPVGTWDNQPVGRGSTVTTKLHRALRDRVTQETR
ncbi:MAG TPA: D-amino acid aminotransferase [Tepidisphaeraceae bacterium]|jgi:D-alanine transaminase